MPSETQKFHLKYHGCDSLLCISVIFLVLVGVVMVYSASAVHALEDFQDSSHILKRHLLCLALGTGLLLAARKIDYHRWNAWTYPIMIMTLILLMAVMIPGLGKKVDGAQRWLSIWGYSFQPSELAKFTLVLFVAKSLVKRVNDLKNFAYGYLPNLIVLGFFFVPILFQPDLGTTMIIATVTFTMLFLGGIRKKFLILSGVVLIPFVISAVLSAEYRIRRIRAFLKPWEDPSDSGLQITQSFFAFIRGNFWGVGLGDSSQKLYYLPEPHTDFIFSIIGEELGFIGTVFIVALFFILIWRGFLTAYRAKDAFGTHLAFGLTLLIGIQALINMGVTVGILPTKGLTLPFISVGGSSLVVSMLCIGVLLNISEQTVQRNPH